MKVFKPIITGSLALGLAVGGVSFAQQQPNQQNQMNNRTAQPEVTFVAVGVYVPVQLPNLPAGFAPKNLDERDDLHGVIASATEAALTEDGFDDLVERLVDQDRNRIGQNDFTDRKFADLNGRMAQIRKAFKDKYGKDFDLDDESTVFNDRYTIVTGEVADPAVIASHWPVPVSRQLSDMSRTNLNEPEARTAAGQTPATPLREDRIEAMNLEKGRNVAILGFPGLGNLPELHVSMIHEVIGWKIDIPNTITGQRLHDSLLRNLTYVGEHTNQWPANVDEARRLISHYVIASLYDVGPQQLSQRQTPNP